MRLSRPLSSGLALLAIAACSDTPPEPHDPIVGHFIGPAWESIEPQGYYMALSLSKVTDDTVTGTGWLSGLLYPAIPFQINGTYSPPNLDLALTGEVDGRPVASLTGVVSPSGLIGEWTRSGASLPLHLARIDTNATATFQATITGAVSFSHAGEAGFDFRSTLNLTTLWLAWANSADPIFAVEWTGPPLGTGTYDLVSSSKFQNAAVYPTGGLGRFNVVSGTLTVDVSTEYAMIGRVHAEAHEEGGTRVLVFEAQFSAGCAALPCRP